MIKRTYLLFEIFLCFTGLTGMGSNLFASVDTSNVRQLTDQASAFRNIYPDSAMAYSQKAFELAAKSNNQALLSVALQSLGKSYIQSENFEKATDCFLQALNIEENRRDKHRVADLSDDMGYIYYLLERFQTSLDYFNKSLDLFQNANDSIKTALVLRHIGKLHDSRKYCENRSEAEQKSDHETAVEFYLRSVEICQKIQDTEGLADSYLNLGNVYKKLAKTDLANEYLQKALLFYQEKNDIDGLNSVYYNLGLLYTYLKDYNKAIGYYKNCEAISKKHNQTQGIQFLYGEMAYTYDRAKNYKLAKDYYVKYMTLRDSVYNSEKSKQIFELETKYQTEKKEKEILKLSIDKKRRNFLISLLLTILVFMIITSWYILLRSRQKRLFAEQEALIKDQKIRELEQKRMLEATQSVLTGEEKERRRLARDLHDGLGGMLSGIKLKLTNMKGNFILDENGKSDFDKALEMLDGSVRELRQVAHNMMPEALIKFGLKDALDDFCSALDSPGGTKIKFRFYGEHQRIDQTLEIAIYRIAQELINNSLKHSAASEILIDLVQDNERISLTVEDNGKGFDIGKISEFKGLGLNSLKSRVNALNGIIDIMSGPGKGTEIKVEFSLR